MNDTPDRSKYATHLGHLHDPEDRGWVRGKTPGELIDMVWPLTLQAWAFKEGLDHEPRLQRHVVRTLRGKR